MAVAPFEFEGTFIKPGKRAVVELEIARLPSGTVIHMPVHIFHGKEPGPTVLLSGGLHGDEINGIETIRRIIASKMLNKLKCGTVLALPIINVYGFINFSRDVPDGKDVNRSFPGSAEGSLASLVAYTLTQKILPHIDFGVDFHTGGASRTNYPQIRFDKQDTKARDLAALFKAPFTLYSGIIANSLRASAMELGKPIIVYEGGEALRFSEFAIDEAIRGTKRVLFHYGMIKSNPKPRRQTLFQQSSWVRAEVSGLFSFRKQSGQKVKEGEVIGKINSPHNDYSVKIISPFNGSVIGHNNFPLVHKGDAIFHIAYDELLLDSE